MSHLDLALQLLPIETLRTLYMVCASAVCAILLGLPLGVWLTLFSPGGLKECKALYYPLGVVVNVGRSIPFAILIIAVFPFTRLIVGTSIGTTASIVPLTIAAAPFFARIVEGALKEVDFRLIEAGRVMGSNTWHIVSKILIPEALISLVRGITLMFVTLIGYSAMAGLVGGGGLGKIAIQYGYQRFNGTLMLLTLAVLLLLVEAVQWLGAAVAYGICKKRGLK